MSNAKEFEQSRLSPTLNPRYSGKTVSNTRLSKAGMGAEGYPYTRDPLWSRAKESPGWWCCVKAGGLDVLPAQQPTSFFPWLSWKFLPLLTHSIFFPNLWWDSHMGCGICEPQITFIWKERFGKYTDDISILSFECLHSHMPMYNIASQKNTFKIIILMNL